MTSSEPVRVVLKLVPGEETISGRIAVDDVSEGDFYGWLELIDRLQRAIGGPVTKQGEEARYGL